jgi:hypothetical protein
MNYPLTNIKISESLPKFLKESLCRKIKVIQAELV